MILNCIIIWYNLFSVSKRILKEVRRSQDEEVFPHAFCNDEFGSIIPDSDKDRATITSRTVSYPFHDNSYETYLKIFLVYIKVYECQAYSCR